MSTQTVSTVSNGNAIQADEVPAHVQEASAFLKQVQELADLGNGLKPDALKEVARKLGASANKFGRPELVRFVGFALAMSSRNLSFNARVQLAQTANGAVLFGNKEVFRTSSKASEIEGGMSYKLNMPAQFETAVG